MILLMSFYSLVSIWIFFAFCCSFWIFVPTKSHNEHCDAQMETSTKNQNEQQKAITSNKRHLPVLVFEIELILFSKTKKKQRRAVKGNERQMETRTKNQNEQQRAFFIPIFIHSHQFWTCGRWLISRAMKSQKEQRRATKSNEKQQKATKSNKKATTDIGAGKTKTGKKKPKDEQRKKKPKDEKAKRRATKGTKSPNGNQAYHLKSCFSKAWFPFGLFVPFVARLGFFLPVLVFPALMSVVAFCCSS